MPHPIAPTPSDLPSPRYYHLLGWLLASALLLFEQDCQTAALNTSRLFGRMEVVETIWQATSRYLTCLAIGGQLAIVAFGVSWWQRGLRFPTQPGHWLTIFQIAAGLSLIGCQWWSIQIQRDEDPTAANSRISHILLFQLCWYGAMAMFGIWLARQRRDDKQWRVLYVGAACSVALAALPAALFFSPMAESWFIQVMGPHGWQHYREYATAAIPVGMFAGIATCMGLDLLEKSSRDWVHWTGITLYLVSCGLTIAASMA